LRYTSFLFHLPTGGKKEERATRTLSVTSSRVACDKRKGDAIYLLLHWPGQIAKGKKVGNRIFYFVKLVGGRGEEKGVTSLPSKIPGVWGGERKESIILASHEKKGGLSLLEKDLGRGKKKGERSFVSEQEGPAKGGKDEKTANSRNRVRRDSEERRKRHTHLFTKQEPRPVAHKERGKGEGHTVQNYFHP